MKPQLLFVASWILLGVGGALYFARTTPVSHVLLDLGLAHPFVAFALGVVSGGALFALAAHFFWFQTR